jgi:hypothetical protein
MYLNRTLDPIPVQAHDPRKAKQAKRRPNAKQLKSLFGEVPKSDAVMT